MSAKPQPYRWVPEWVPSLREAARRLQVSPSTVHAWAKRAPGAFKRGKKGIDLKLVRLWRRLHLEFSERPRFLDCDID